MSIFSKLERKNVIFSHADTLEHEAGFMYGSRIGSSVASKTHGQPREYITSIRLRLWLRRDKKENNC